MRKKYKILKNYPTIGSQMLPINTSLKTKTKNPEIPLLNKIS